MSSQNSIFVNESTVRLSIEEFEYLKQCEKELMNVKELIGELLGGEQA